METGHSDTITDGIRIRVAAEFVEEQSDPERGLYLYKYRVVIENVGEQRACLLSRHWIIRDADGNQREVKGPGVVGEHPDLAPGETFVYMSGCPLATEWGTMEGTYRMRRDDGSEFDAAIGRFFLARNVAPLPSLMET